jgi:hypothetical protein
MSVLRDFRQILSGTYIEPIKMQGFKTNSIPNQVYSLQHELIQLAEQNKHIIEAALRMMAELSIYKRALDMEVRANQVPDPKVPERVYIQVRGAVPIAKGKRIWVGHYIGKREEVFDLNGKVLPAKMDEGREAVVQKVVDRYLAEELG